MQDRKYDEELRKRILKIDKTETPGSSIPAATICGLSLEQKLKTKYSRQKCNVTMLNLKKELTVATDSCLYVVASCQYGIGICLI